MLKLYLLARRSLTLSDWLGIASALLVCLGLFIPALQRLLSPAACQFIGTTGNAIIETLGIGSLLLSRRPSVSRRCREVLLVMGGGALLVQVLKLLTEPLGLFLRPSGGGVERYPELILAEQTAGATSGTIAIITSACLRFRRSLCSMRSKPVIR